MIHIASSEPFLKNFSKMAKGIGNNTIHFNIIMNSTDTSCSVDTHPFFNPNISILVSSNGDEGADDTPSMSGVVQGMHFIYDLYCVLEP